MRNSSGDPVYQTSVCRWENLWGCSQRAAEQGGAMTPTWAEEEEWNPNDDEVKEKFECLFIDLKHQKKKNIHRSTVSVSDLQTDGKESLTTNQPTIIFIMSNSQWVLPVHLLNWGSGSETDDRLSRAQMSDA